MQGLINGKPEVDISTGEIEHDMNIYKSISTTAITIITLGCMSGSSVHSIEAKQSKSIQAIESPKSARSIIKSEAIIKNSNKEKSALTNLYKSIDFYNRPHRQSTSSTVRQKTTIKVSPLCFLIEGFF